MYCAICSLSKRQKNGERTIKQLCAGSSIKFPASNCSIFGVAGPMVGVGSVRTCYGGIRGCTFVVEGDLRDRNFQLVLILSASGHDEDSKI